MLPLFFCLFLSVVVVNGSDPLQSRGCDQAEILQLMPCLDTLENPKVNSTLLQQFRESFSTGNLTDPMPVTDAVCRYFSTLDTCARPVAANCLYLAAQLDVYESVVEVCRSPNVYTSFINIIGCSYKLNLSSTVADDYQFSGYIQDFLAAMANASRDSIRSIECRIIERVREMFPLETVNETCGADVYETYGTLYPAMLELYKCKKGSLEHNETGTTESGCSGGSTAYPMYSFLITLSALAFLGY